MNTALTTETKRPVVMKNGLTLWVTDETATKLEQHMVSQKGHGFIRLQEANTTINTAEVQGIYTASEYENLQRIKEGQWQCQYQTWHMKKDRCTCKSDKMREAQRKVDQEARLRPLTPEERERAQELARKSGETMVLSGLIKATGRKVRRSTLIDYEQAGKPVRIDLDSLNIEEDL